MESPQQQEVDLGGGKGFRLGGAEKGQLGLQRVNLSLSDPLGVLTQEHRKVDPG